LSTSLLFIISALPFATAPLSHHGLLGFLFFLANSGHASRPSDGSDRTDPSDPSDRSDRSGARAVPLRACSCSLLRSCQPTLLDLIRPRIGRLDHFPVVHVQGCIQGKQPRAKTHRWNGRFSIFYLVCLAISSRTFGTSALGISMNVWEVSS